jgi:hypothetical protein
MFSAARASKIYLPVNVSSRLGYRRELERERFKVTTGRGGGRAHLRHLRRGQIYQRALLGATSLDGYTGTLLWRCSGKVGAMARGGARQRSEFQHFQGKRGKEPRATRERRQRRTEPSNGTDLFSSSTLPDFLLFSTISPSSSPYTTPSQVGSTIALHDPRRQTWTLTFTLTFSLFVDDRTISKPSLASYFKRVGH